MPPRPEHKVIEMGFKKQVKHAIQHACLKQKGPWIEASVVHDGHLECLLEVRGFKEEHVDIWRKNLQ